VPRVPDRATIDAVAFARRYVALVDALLKEGVAEPVARQEARLAAVDLLIEGRADEGEHCPYCGRGGTEG
jgi:hypothetical protein